MVTWLIGLAGSGKTSIGRCLTAQLRRRNPATVLLDGDDFRNIMGSDLGHTLEAREDNGWRICRMCEFLDREGIDVVCCILSMFPEQQAWNRRTYSRYFEIYISVSLDELKRRDQKGLYSGAENDSIKNVAGIDLYFPEPAHPDLVVENVTPRQEFSSVAKEIVRAMDSAAR